MQRVVMSGLVLVLVASCGGSGGSRNVVSRVVGAGPITTACIQAARNGATRERCGCVQKVADKSLSASDQKLGASFFSDPHRAQEIRQSSSPSHSAFWERWVAFGEEAGKLCT